MRMKAAAVMVMFCMLVSGCASIVSKSDWPVALKSTPEQAEVTVTDDKGVKIFQGKTPASVTLSSKGGYFKGKSYTATFSKEGYEPQSVVIQSQMNGWYVGNIIFGGLIGLLIVDPLTGAMWTIDPKDLSLTLNKKTASADKGKTLTVVSLDNVPNELRDKMVRIR